MTLASPSRDCTSSCVAAALLCLALTTPLMAQSVLAPNSHDITTSHIRAEAGRDYRFLSRDATGDTSEKERGRGRVTQQLVQHEGAPALLLITNGTFGARAFVDTALMLLAGLTPVREVSYILPGTHVTRWEYSGAHVSGTFVTDSGTRKTQHTFDVPVFHFQELDLLIQSLPLAAGYERILPLYSEGTDVLEMDSVRVEAREPNGVWRVRFADPAIVSTYRIDGKTREIVGFDVVSRASGRRQRRVAIAERELKP